MKTVRRPPPRKAKVVAKKATNHEKVFRQALLDALEMCWDGRMPFAPLERALKTAP